MKRIPLRMAPATVADKNPRHKSLVVTRGSRSAVVPASNLIQVFQPGDVLVYNNSSVLPARFHMRHPVTGEDLEMRLARALAHPGAFSHWRVVIWEGFTWRERTENRRPLLGLVPGTQLTFAANGLGASSVETAKVRIHRGYPFGLYDIEIVAADAASRSANAAASLDRESPLALLLRLGLPIQYSYHGQDLKLWDMQTLFTGPPLSLEPPSAAFILDWEMVGRLVERGVELAPISHAAGISSVGINQADKQLPLPEPSYLSVASAERLNAAKAQGRRIVALGTTVARSLESAARRGDHGNAQTLHLEPGWFETRLRLGPKQKALFCDALITGLHEETESHFLLEQAFINREAAMRANTLAATTGLRHHEFGDFHYLEKEVFTKAA